MADRSRVVSFPVWPDRAKKPHYYKVFVFGSRRAMEIFWAAHAKKVGIDETCDFLAVTSSWTEHHLWREPSKKGGRRRWLQGHCIGHMLFHHQRLGAGIVAHECGHAALRFAELILKIQARDLYHGRQTRSDDNSGEERMLHCLGRMVSQFWRGFYARSPKSWGRP